MSQRWKIPFGDLRIGPLTKRRVWEALDSNWISEGRFVREFEEKFAAKFGWKHAIATSSGTDAGTVVWSAVRELCGGCYGEGAIITPACAFAASTNCILASGAKPDFADVSLETLNLNPVQMKDLIEIGCIGIQFVATMGKPSPIKEVAEIAEARDLYLIGDWCEAHGAYFQLKPRRGLEWTGNYGGTWQYADHLCDASIYSFYAAHLIVGGEGGMICTDYDEIAELCRSIKSHGRPPKSNYFDFQRVGFNSKWNELCAAVALESLERFDETFAKRREVRQKLVDALAPFEDRLILYRDEPGEIIAPHAFPVVLRDSKGDDLTSVRPIYHLYRALEDAGVQCKTLFGSLPTQHRAFDFLGYKLGDFPVAERIGRTGLHFGCHEYMTNEDIELIVGTIGNYLREDA